MSNSPKRKTSRAQQRSAATPPRPGGTSGSGGGNARLLLFGGLAAIVAIAIAVGVLATSGDDGTAGAVEVGFAETIGDPLPAYGGGDDPAVGMTAPTLRARSALTGDIIDVDMDDGTVKMIGFFAHWCPVCQRELPAVVEAVTASPLPDGVEMIAVSTAVDQGRGNYPPTAWFDREGWPNEVLVDNENGGVANAFGLSAYPYWVVVGPDGRVLERLSGELSADGIQAFLTRAVAAAT